MSWTRRLAPIALLACLSLAGCLGGPTGLRVDAYETSEIAVTSWSNDADRTLTVHLRVRGEEVADAANRTLEPGETDEGAAELECPTSGDVTVTAVAPDGTTIAEETIDCRPWPTVWEVSVRSDAVEVERAA